MRNRNCSKSQCLCEELFCLLGINMLDAGRSKRQKGRRFEGERVLATSGRFDKGRFLCCDFFGTCACCPLVRASGYCYTRSCPIYGRERYLNCVESEQEVNVAKESTESEDSIEIVSF